MAGTTRTGRLRQRRTARTIGLVALTCVGLLTGAGAGRASEPPRTSAPAPVLASDPHTVVAGRYIVVLKAGESTDAAARRARTGGGHVRSQYGHAVAGYAADLDTAQLDTVRHDPAVAYVEPDQVMHASSVDWGLDRLDTRTLSLDSAYTPATDAQGTPLDGTGVTAYVIDTGIRTTHTEFGTDPGKGRASLGTTSILDGNGAADCNGHGTHVAATIGGTTYGVAKKVNLVSVRVLDCQGSGTTSGVIAGVEWVTVNHASPAVANLSLGGSASTALDSAVAASIASGVTYSIAAGNSRDDACRYSPARVPAAITVGASTVSDSRDTSYSNYGSCVDLFAPGTAITSATSASDTSTATWSGTSMASPHVAGVAALYLQVYPQAGPAQVAAAITSNATPSVLGAVGSGSPNLLLYAGGPMPAPSASPNCSSPTQLFTGSLSRSGSSVTLPSGGYTTTASGTQLGCLTGPAAANFDLSLYQRSGTRWVAVAGGTGSTSTETVSYSGPAGSYRWVVTSSRGSGAFSLVTVRP